MGFFIYCGACSAKHYTRRAALQQWCCKGGDPPQLPEHGSTSGNITLSLYSPMVIKVVCAASRADASTGAGSLELAKNSADDIIIETFSEAAKLSAERNEPVYAEFK